MPSTAYANLPRWDYNLLPAHGRLNTRFARLYKDDEGADICVDLLTFDLSRSVNYTALSYCWGSADLNRRIIIAFDGQQYQHMVTANLYEALRAVRSSIEATSILVWADAICIDQNDDDDKARQILFMPRIFPAAKVTVCYVGPANDISATDLTLLHMLSMRETSQRDLTARTKLELFQASGRADLVLRDILTREWFERAWCLQEGYRPLRDSALLLCGDNCLQLSTLVATARDRFANIEASLTDPHIRDRFNASIQLLCLSYYDRSQIRMSALLGFASARKASILRDRFYALLGMIDETDKLPRPDYSLSDREVCIAFTRGIIEQEKRLFALQILEPDIIATNTKLRLPSWCLSLEPFPKSLQVLENRSPDIGVSTPFSYAASKGEDVVLLPAHAIDDEILGLKGQKLDVIKAVVDWNGLKRAETSLQSAWFMCHSTLSNQAGVGSLIASFRSPSAWMATHLLQAMDAGSTIFSGSRGTARLKRFHESYAAEHARIASKPSNARPCDTIPASMSILQMCCSNFPYDDYDAFSARRGDQALGVPFEWLRREAKNMILADPRLSYIFITTAGRHGAAYNKIQAGDRVFIVPGSTTPMIMQALPDSPGAWRYCGEAYINGIMQGEAYDRTKLEDVFVQ